jgi:hypothetical protein
VLIFSFPKKSHTKNITIGNDQSIYLPEIEGKYMFIINNVSTSNQPPNIANIVYDKNKNVYTDSFNEVDFVLTNKMNTQTPFLYGYAYASEGTRYFGNPATIKSVIYSNTSYNLPTITYVYQSGFAFSFVKVGELNSDKLLFDNYQLTANNNQFDLKVTCTDGSQHDVPNISPFVPVITQSIKKVCNF